MSTATLTAPKSGAATGIDYLFLGAALLVTAVLVALVLLDGQPASAALILGGFGLGIAFLKADFSYTVSRRRFITCGEAGGLIGGLIVIAICALVVAGGGDPTEFRRRHRAARAVAPDRRFRLRHRHAARQRLRFRHALYGRRRLRTNAGDARIFIIGSVFGSLSLPSFLALGGVDPILGVGLSRPLGRSRRHSGQHCAGSSHHGRGGAQAWRQLAAGAQLHHRRHRHRAFVHRRVLRRRPSVERDLRLHDLGRQDFRRARFRLFQCRLLAMAGQQAGARQFGFVRYIEPDRLRHDLRRDGRGGRDPAVRVRAVAAAEIAARGRRRRSFDGLGCETRLRLQYRRLCRRRGSRDRCMAGSGSERHWLVARSAYACGRCSACRRNSPCARRTWSW